MTASHKKRCSTDDKLKKFLDNAVKKGKLTQQESEAKIKKHDKKDKAKKAYKDKGKSPKKDEIITLLEDLTE